MNKRINIDFQTLFQNVEVTNKLQDLQARLRDSDQASSSHNSELIKPEFQIIIPIPSIISGVLFPFGEERNGNALFYLYAE